MARLPSPASNSEVALYVLCVHPAVGALPEALGCLPAWVAVVYPSLLETPAGFLSRLVSTVFGVPVDAAPLQAYPCVCWARSGASAAASDLTDVFLGASDTSTDLDCVSSLDGSGFSSGHPSRSVTLF